MLKSPIVTVAGDSHISGVTEAEVTGRVSKAILDFVGNIPASQERKSDTPMAAARSRANNAAAKAALAAGTLALPPGPLGWLTILPEMIAVWKIQSQMVSDMAALYGKDATLTQEQLIYCLFRHTAAQAVRDIVVRVGERVMIRRTSLKTMQTITRKIGIRVTQTTIGKSVSRWLPIVGAVGVGAYAYYDTVQVARTAMELFEKPIELEPEPRATV